MVLLLAFETAKTMQKLTQEMVDIREVWCYNIELQFKLIRSVVDDFPFIGIDTKFPRTVVWTCFRGQWCGLEAQRPRRGLQSHEGVDRRVKVI